jgi:hypothetical protein
MDYRKYFPAGGLNYPRFMAFDAGDVLHLSDMSRGRILALPDLDRNGVADRSPPRFTWSALPPTAKRPSSTPT